MHCYLCLKSSPELGSCRIVLTHAFDLGIPVVFRHPYLVPFDKYCQTSALALKFQSCNADDLTLGLDPEMHVT